MNKDSELVSITLSGDKSAFGGLVSRYQKKVYRLTRRIISNSSDASDIVQETFVKAYQNLEQLKDRDKFSLWLFQIAKNQCISWIRRYQKNLIAVEDEMASNRLHLPPAPDEILMERELYEQVMKAISELPEYDRKAVQMFYLEGKSYSEIQNELGITKGTLGRLLYHARVKLRKSLQETYQSALLWVSGGLKRTLELVSKQAGTATDTAVVSAARCLMISMALHALFFAGMPIIGAHWGATGTDGMLGRDPAVGTSLMKTEVLELPLPPSQIHAKLSPRSTSWRRNPKQPQGRESKAVENVTPKSLSPKRLRNRIIQTISVPTESERKFGVVLPLNMLHIQNRLNCASIDLILTPIRPAMPWKRSQNPPRLSNLVHDRSGNELVILDNVVQPVADPFHDQVAQPKILFISNNPLISDQERRFQPEIFAMSIDGTRIVRITDFVFLNTPGDEKRSIFPPDTPISQEELEKISNRISLVNPGGISVSPNERQIAFHARVSGTKWYIIYVMDINGKNYRPLTFGFNPAWSPDGRNIAFCRRERENTEIYVINADGSDPVQIMKNRSSNHHPTWSPDGTRIAFSSNMKMDRRISNIYLMDADGSNQKPLTHNTTIGRWNDHPAWSPDGRRIAYASGKSKRCYAQSSIFIMDVNNGSRRVLITGAYSPSWSSDGQRIVFGSKQDGDDEIYMIDSDGTNLKQLTYNHYCDAEPHWLAFELQDRRELR